MMIYDSVLIFFMDGVGLGENNATNNPFVRAHLPYLTALLGEGWYIKDHGHIIREQATLIPTDASMSVLGRPQSATGQATILTGRNVPAIVGEHYGPKPNKAVAKVIQEGSIFQEVIDAGGNSTLITPYPQRYFDAINSGKRLMSAVPLAVTNAGIPLLTVDDLRAGRAVSPGFTGQIWRTFLGYKDVPLLTLEEAGQQIAHIAQNHHFSFFEHWSSDRIGHRGSLEEAIAHLEMLDVVIGSLIQTWLGLKNNSLLIITSDHGNIEAKDHRNHTTNPVPTILVGQNHANLANYIHDLSDIVKVVRQVLQLEK